MATSLVSTGVQFPDATTQTTAATLPPGATTQYSLIECFSSDPYLIIPTDLATGAFTAGTFPKTQTNYLANTGVCVWSSFYNLWFTLTPYDNSASIVSLFSSANGVTWRLLILNVYNLSQPPTAGSASASNGFGGPSIAVDETNGRFFIVFRDSSANLRVLYSDITSTCVLTGWTSTIILANASSITSIAYVKMATIGVSGMVIYGFDGTGLNFKIITCLAGSTTFTTSFTSPSPSSLAGTIKHEASGKIAVYLNNTVRVLYNTSGNITTGWAQNTNIGSTPPSGRLGDVGGGYFVSLYDERVIMYSTTGAGTWTQRVVAAGDNQIKSVVFMGTFWAAFCATGTVFTTATTNPSLTWTATTNAQLNRAVAGNNFFAKRVY